MDLTVAARPEVYFHIIDLHVLNCGKGSKVGTAGLQSCLKCQAVYEKAWDDNGAALLCEYGSSPTVPRPLYCLLLQAIGGTLSDAFGRLAR